MRLKYKKKGSMLIRTSSYGGSEYSEEVKKDKKNIGSHGKKIKVKLDKIKERLNQPLLKGGKRTSLKGGKRISLKGGKRTSLGGGKVRVSSAAGIRGFFR